MNKKTLHIVTFLFVFTASFTLYADPASPSTTDPAATQTQQDIQDQIKCDKLISLTLNDYLTGFYEEIDEFLRSPEPVSANLTQLQNSYLTYRSRMEALRSTRLSEFKEEVQTIFDRGTLAQCDSLINDVTLEMELVYNRAIEKSAAKKSALTLVSKFDQINLKLAELANEIDYIAGQVSAFNSRVPCYIESCIR